MKLLLGRFLFDVFVHIADGLELFRIFVGNLRAKLLFKNYRV